MGLRGCGSCYGLRECLPGQWGGCGSKAVSYARRTRTHIFQAGLTVGHARQHSKALPEALFCNCLWNKSPGEESAQTHSPSPPASDPSMRARHASYMH